MRVSRESGEDRTRQAGPRKGGCLVPCQLEVRENTEQRGSQVDLSLVDHSVTALGLDLQGSESGHQSGEQSPVASPFWGSHCSSVQELTEGRPGHKRRGTCRGGLAPHSHADK